MSHTRKIVTKRDNLLEAMASAAAVGFYTSQAFGIDSPEHKATLAPYETAKRLYEAECAVLCSNRHDRKFPPEAI